jgi:hypothetical protein
MRFAINPNASESSNLEILVQPINRAFFIFLLCFVVKNTFSPMHFRPLILLLTFIIIETINYLFFYVFFSPSA